LKNRKQKTEEERTGNRKKMKKERNHLKPENLK
jgi:hypothetical protein